MSDEQEVPAEETPEAEESTPEPIVEDGAEEEPAEPVADNPDGSGEPDEDEEDAESEEASATVDADGVVTKSDGTKVYTKNHSYPVSNGQQAKYELTHQGDQPRYHLVPGDEGYSAYADPSVVNSHLARQVESEIASYAERVLTDPDASVSPMWEQAHKDYMGTLKHVIETDQDTSGILL